MSNVDYSRYAQVRNKAAGEVVETPVEIIPEETVEPMIEAPVESIPEEPVEPEVIPEPEEAIEIGPSIEPAEPKFGRVYNCEKLNVRQEPKATAPIVCELFRNAEVEIQEFGSTDDFYMVYTASGITGFCMKKYILEK